MPSGSRGCSSSGRQHRNGKQAWVGTSRGQWEEGFKEGGGREGRGNGAHHPHQGQTLQVLMSAQTHTQTLSLPRG